MRRDELEQSIRPSAIFAHVIVIERHDSTDGRQALPPTLHPGMRRRRTRAWSEKKKRHELKRDRFLEPVNFALRPVRQGFFLESNGRFAASQSL